MYTVLLALLAVWTFTINESCAMALSLHKLQLELYFLHNFAGSGSERTAF